MGFLGLSKLARASDPFVGEQGETAITTTA
jgi:hypothetical protein